jgi:hypothetical protein
MFGSYPDQYPFMGVVPSLLPPKVSPTRRRASTLAGQFAGFFHFSHQRANPLPADAGTGAFDVKETKLAALFADGAEYHFGLRTFWGIELADALFKLLAGRAEDEEQVVDVRPGVVAAWVVSVKWWKNVSSSPAPLF